MADFDVDAFLAEAVPLRVPVSVCHRQDLAVRHEELEAKLADAQRSDLSGSLGDPKLAPMIAEQLAELEADMEASTREFVFASIGKLAWSDLLAAHPPTSGQRAEGMDHNPATFPDVAIAASCVEPGLRLDQAQTLARKLSFGQWRKLWIACCAANIGNDETPKSVAATLVRRVSGASSTTAAPEGSLAASS